VEVGEWRLGWRLVEAGRLGNGGWGGGWRRQGAWDRGWGMEAPHCSAHSFSCGPFPWLTRDRAFAEPLPCLATDGLWGQGTVGMEAVSGGDPLEGDMVTRTRDVVCVVPLGTGERSWLTEQLVTGTLWGRQSEEERGAVAFVLRQGRSWSPPAMP
jgi:hypothetical protein